MVASKLCNRNYLNITELLNKTTLIVLAGENFPPFCLNQNGKLPSFRILLYLTIVFIKFYFYFL